MRYLYSKWDGSQGLGALHQDQLMDELAEHLLTSGDVNQALRSLLQRGTRAPAGEGLKGLQGLLEQLRALRQQELARYNLDAAVDDLRRRLERLVDAERAGIERRLQEARQQAEAADQLPSPLSPETARQLLDLMERRAGQHLAALDQLPRDLGGTVRELSRYEFMDAGAQAQFQELLQLLQQRMLESHVKELAQRFQGLTPQASQQLRELLEHLNKLLEEKLRGQEPDFQRFREQFGAAFGENPPQGLEELAEQLRQQMSQLHSLLKSLPRQLRESLQQMLDSSIADPDLRMELAQLAANLESLFPQDPSEYLFTGAEPVTLAQALQLMERLQRLDNLDRQLGRARQTGNLEGVDGRGLGELLGAEAQQELGQLKGLAEMLEKAGYIHKLHNRYELTPRGMRKMGQKALQEIFAYIKKDRLGNHTSPRPGQGGEQGDDTKSYEFGDPFRLHLERTLTNALLREAHRGREFFPGPGGVTRLPVRLTPSDFEVYRSQQLSQTATVLMLDLSLSMAMKGSFTAAKKVALALNDLIRTQFPRDRLYIVGFSTYARELKAAGLPYLSWDEFDPYTNMQHGLALSQKLLAKEGSSNKQIIMISDGEPTAHMEGGRLYLGYPPSPRTLQQTLREVKRCTQRGITINTFMLDRSAYLVEFVGQLAKINRGRVFYTSPEKLGQYLLVDYLSARRRQVTS